MNWRHIPLFIIATVITQLLHESAHWAAGEVLGYDMWININSAGLVRGAYTAGWHQQFVSAAGPLITMMQSVIALILVHKYKAIGAFAFVFAPFMMRLVAMAVSINNPNDEARISEWLGLGPWTLHFVVVALLLILTAKGGSFLKLGWRSYGLAYLAVSIAFTCIIIGESFLPNFNPHI